MMDKIIYKATINGIAAKLNNNNNMSEITNMINLIKLSLSNFVTCKFIFIENNSILLIISIDNMIEVKHKKIILS